MKYSVQQIEQALKDGKIIFFDTARHEDLYKAKLQGKDVLVFWETNNNTTYILPKFLNNFHNSEHTNWICNKIEGEEITEKKTTPHKHAELIKLWADTGCQIQCKFPTSEIWYDCSNNLPCWELDNEYRVKPTLVKKWKWVFKDSFGDLGVTDNAYAEQDFNKQYPRLTLIQKIDSTMIEVEE